MSNQPEPWSNQPGQPTGPAFGPGWAQPGPTPPAPPVYGPVPTHYSGAAGGYPAPPSLGPPPPNYPAAPGYGPPPPIAYGPPLRTDYATWGKRVGGYLIDHIPTYIGLIIFYVGYVVWIFQFSASAGTGTIDWAGGLLPMIIGSAIMLAGLGWTIYNRWLVGGRTGQSLGKRVTRTKLVGELTDAPIGPMNAFVRDLVHILDGMAYVGYLWPLWDDRRQTFADKIVRTVVVNAS
jgi:uncharacterized RDD family membrane protein YckC